MDLAPLVVIVILIALLAFSMGGRMRQGSEGTTDLKPPGEPGDVDRPDSVSY